LVRLTEIKEEIIKQHLQVLELMNNMVLVEVGL
jgi:hypothetical protein